MGTRDGGGIAPFLVIEWDRGGGKEDGGAEGGASGGGGRIGGSGSALMTELRVSCSRGSSAGSSVTLGTMSDRNSRSSEESAIEAWGLDVGTAVLLREKRPKNRETAEGAGGGLCVRSNTGSGASAYEPPELGVCGTLFAVESVDG